MTSNEFTKYGPVEEELKKARAEYDNKIRMIKRASPILQVVKETAEEFDDRLVPETVPGLATIPNPHIVSFFDVEVVMEVAVIHFSDVLPVLEKLEEYLGMRFDRTSDEAQMGFRRYQGRVNSVPIEVRGIPDIERGAACRQVPTGEKRDIYQLECN